MATIAKNDFIEIEFTGESSGEVFDTTDKEVAKKLDVEADVKPMIVSVGNEMLLKGLDDDLVGKEVGKSYKLLLPAEKAFGKRNASMIKIVPMKVFHEKEINPYPGLSLQMDNYVVKILTVSGGRVTVDFNNPLAGKDVEYDYKITKKIEDTKEKVDALQDFFFRQRFPFEVKDKKVIFSEEKIKPFIEAFKPKFKEISGLDFEVAASSSAPKQEAKKETRPAVNPVDKK